MGILVRELSNGVYLPAVALGTWQLESEEAPGVILPALREGYRCIDDAWIYGNEEAVGKEVQKWDGKVRKAMEMPIRTAKSVAVSEQDFLENFKVPHGPPQDDRKAFVTSKIWCSFFEPKDIPGQVELHLKNFGRSSCDLMILHWPGQHPDWGNEELQQKLNNDAARVASWRAMEKEYHTKRVRAIGVSNYMARHLEVLVKDVKQRQAQGDKSAVMPMYNQIEINPLLPVDEDLARLCEEHNIVIASYSTIGGKAGKDKVVNHEQLAALARKYNRSVPQIILRWAMQKEYHVLPKSAHAERVSENFNVFDFELSAQDMAAVDSLGRSSKLYFNSDPHHIP